MSVKRFYITKDTTITNAYKEDLTLRATSANMGLSDSLEAFFIFNQAPNAVGESRFEESRILIYPNLSDIWSYYTTFPQDTKFILRMFNAVHPFTLPKNFTLTVYSGDTAWDEGHGLDMESYRDEGAPTWSNSAATITWATTGAVDKTDNAIIVGSQHFTLGTEDLEIDITNWIETNWNGSANLFFAIAFPEASTDGSAGNQTVSLYTKKFFARSSEFFFKRPIIEARKASFRGDDRGRFYKSSPLTANNEQNLYLYNTVSGVREDIAGTVALEVFSDAAMTNSIGTGTVTKPETGIYKAAITIASSVTATTVYEKWTSDDTVIKTGEIKLLTRTPESDSGDSNYILDITNLKPSYTRTEKAKFRIYTRAKDWSPTIYTVASKAIENLIVEKIYYKIVRVVDNQTVIDYGNGTTGLNKDHTLVSYDSNGSYFDLDMSMLEEGYMYGIKFKFSINGELKEQEETFKFRVD